MTSETAAAARTRRFYAWEVGIVLALSLGRSAVYAVLQLAESLQVAPLADQAVSVERARSRHEIFDLSYQLADIIFALAPVALVVYLAFLHGYNPFRRWGLDLRRPGQDLSIGVVLLLVIGLGTLGVYSAGRALGITALMVPTAMAEYWWTAPMLLLSAVRHALLEEVIMIAYLFDRARRIWPGLQDRGRGPWLQGSIWLVILGSALLRGCYHLYQGFGPGVGNALMGVIFGWLYVKYGRVMPLVIAHFLLDAVAFLAYPLVLTVFGIDRI